MRHFTYLLVALALITAGCTKSDSNTATVDTGSIRFTNTSSNPYEIFLDGADKGAQPGGTYSTITNVTVGSHTVKASQNSGYIISPTVRNGTLTVTKGQEISFVFP